VLLSSSGATIDTLFSITAFLKLSEFIVTKLIENQMSSLQFILRFFNICYVVCFKNQHVINLHFITVTSVSIYCLQNY
jgi:hypothetical protein